MKETASEQASKAIVGVDALFERLDREAEVSGYHLNPDESFTRELVEGLVANVIRYGYQACPCRLAEGDRHADLHIVCPCDYRDADLLDYDACCCGLYVSEAVLAGEREATPIPERRAPERSERPQFQPPPRSGRSPNETGLPIGRCRVCSTSAPGTRPPGVCPVCKAEQDRFECFL